MDLVFEDNTFWNMLLVVGLALFVLYIWSIVWAYRDAKQRGKPAWAVALLVAIFSWPLSLLLWIVFRPDKIVNPKDSAII